MKWHRVRAVFLRHYHQFFRLDSVCDIFYWPILDILLWGLASVWMNSHSTGTPFLVQAVLTGLIFWQVMWRGNYEIGVPMISEIWSRNLVNFFASPLKVTEWFFGVVLLGLLKVGIAMCFGALLIFLLFEMNVFQLGWIILPYAISLTISGWFIGLLAASALIYFGQRFQMVAWMAAWIFVPFSAIFYPLSALPPWAQAIGTALPMSHIFEGMRQVLFKGVIDWSELWISFGLNILYLGAAVVLFNFCFKKSREKGLSRLE